MLYRKITSYLENHLKSGTDKILINPVFPLSESLQKNLLKLYLNDVGLLTGQLYHNNIRPVLDDIRSINLGSVYESVVAQELRAHGHKLFYYDQRKQGEVDYLIDNHTAMRPHPIEVKSGKDYTVHSALNNLLGNPDYHIPSATVVSNEREIYQDGKVTYMPVYLVMFLTSMDSNSAVFGSLSWCMESDAPAEDESEYIF